MTHPQIAQRVFHTPLLAAPAKAAGFVMGLGSRILGGGSIELKGFEGVAVTGPASQPFASLLDDRVGDQIRAGKAEAFRIVDGVAVIPVTGTLIHRGAWVGSFSGEMSYEGISAQIKAAASHSSVRAIALEIDSHGGEVAGCFDLAAEIRAARDEKPVHAFVCDNAHSAAYALASQATRVIVPRAGSAGSIGVICMHADRSQQLEAVGVSVTIIAAGKHKADGNPYEPLPEAVRDSLKREMETLRGIFAETVAAGRGASLSADAALATEAACLLGQDAVDAGLADEVASPKEAFEQLAAQFSWRRAPLGKTATKEGPLTMATPEDDEQSGGGVNDTPNAGTKTPEAGDGGGAPEANAGGQQEPQGTSAPEGKQSSLAATSGADEERQRIMGILGCEEAQGRSALASSLANDPHMTVEQAKKHLAAAGKEGSGRTLSDLMEGEAEADLDQPPPAAERGGGLAAKAKARFSGQ
ncbi:S49 family peptidase [Leisingera caerulea]|uniref:S49 family peptidase n=1 Tax=Leisingera caerulea TaxID=506591 RepID=UPI0004267880|nr:S49 family peptidase [Leisingera caerulea]